MSGVELRYIWGTEAYGENTERRVKILQYRQQETVVTKNGGYCGMSELIDVPVVEDED